MNKDKINFRLGSDPELFLTREIKGEKSFYSPEGIISGTKSEPDYIDGSEYRAILLDNVSLEFLTMPADNVDDFIEEHDFMVQYCRTAMSVYGLEVSLDSVAKFNPHFLDTDNAKEFGCSESFNAKSGKANIMPDASESNKRSCGGHLHVSIDDYTMTFDDCKEITKIMDLHLGVPSVIMSKDTERRKMFYGKAGEFRHQRERYLEYRALDNFWIFDERLMQWTWDATEKSLRLFLDGFRVDKDKYNTIEGIINNYDIKDAKELCDTDNLLLTIIE